MDMVFYIIIIFLIFIKVSIWICVIRSRRERHQAALRQRGIIIVATDPGPHSQIGVQGSGHILRPDPAMYGYPPQGIDNPQMFSGAPPSYEEVVQSKAAESKPPAYDQILQPSAAQTGYTPQSQTTPQQAQQ